MQNKMRGKSKISRNSPASTAEPAPEMITPDRISSLFDTAMGTGGSITGSEGTQSVGRSVAGSRTAGQGDGSANLRPSLRQRQHQVGLSITITGWNDRARDEKGKAYTEYILKISAGDREGIPWEARKRYSEFSKFKNDFLKQRDFENAPTTVKKIKAIEFPAKTVRHVLKEKALEYRRQILQRFLTILARDPNAGRNEFFLGFDTNLALRIDPSPCKQST